MHNVATSFGGKTEEVTYILRSIHVYADDKQKTLMRDTTTLWLNVFDTPDDVVITFQPVLACP